MGRPKMEGNAQSRATARYDRKRGVIAKTYKLPANIVEAFGEACEVNGISQSAQLAKYMRGYCRRADVEIED